MLDERISTPSFTPSPHALKTSTRHPPQARTALQARAPSVAGQTARPRPSPAVSVGKRGHGAIAGVARVAATVPGTQRSEGRPGIARPRLPALQRDPRRRCRWLRPEARGTPSVASGRVVLGLGLGTGAAACQSVHQPPSPAPRHGTARRRPHRHRDPNARMTRLSTLKRGGFMAVSCNVSEVAGVAGPVIYPGRIVVRDRPLASA